MSLATSIEGVGWLTYAPLYKVVDRIGASVTATRSNVKRAISSDHCPCFNERDLKSLCVVELFEANLLIYLGHQLLIRDHREPCGGKCGAGEWSKKITGGSLSLHPTALLG